MERTKKDAAAMTMAELIIENARLEKQYQYHSQHNAGMITDKVKIRVGATWMIRYKANGTTKLRRARKDENLDLIQEANITTKAVSAKK